MKHTCSCNRAVGTWQRPCLRLTARNKEGVSYFGENKAYRADEIRYFSQTFSLGRAYADGTRQSEASPYSRYDQNRV